MFCTKNIDFPASAKVSKVDAKHPKKCSKMEVSSPKNTTTSYSEVDSNASGSESDTTVQPSIHFVVLN